MYYNDHFFFFIFNQYTNTTELLQHPLWGHTRSEQRGTIPTFDLLDKLLLMQPSVHLYFYAVNTLCWIMCMFLPTKTPSPSFQNCSSFHSSPSLCSCLGLPWPRCRTLHLPILDFMMFPQVTLSSLWMVSPHSSKSTALHSSVPSVLRTCLIPLSMSLTKGVEMCQCQSPTP